jgi:hypothetical protein
MLTRRTLSLLLLLTTTGSGLIAARSPAFAQSNCDWYARTALRQQQENERLKCGFKGDAWHTDLKAHSAWCAGVAPDTWKTQAQKRDQELVACSKK